MISTPRITLLVLSLMALHACGLIGPKPTLEELTVEAAIRKHLTYEFTNPRYVQGEMILTISNIKKMEEDSLHTMRTRHDIPQDALPRMEIWSSDVNSYPTQWLVAETKMTPPPAVSYTEPRYGNRIQYYWLTDSLSFQDSIRISRRFSYITYDYKPDVNSERESDFWDFIPPALLETYTRSEPFLEQDEVLKDTVAALIKGIDNPVTKAKTIFDWIQNSMVYVYPPEERGAAHAFQNRTGDCGQYSALFITMARIAGIPARQISGYNFNPGKIGAHVWSEIYLPRKGWVPVDATREDGFLRLDNGRLITSIGLNIPLEPVPEWATFKFSEVEDDRTDFMQFFTLLNFGYHANFQTELKIIRSVNL